MIRTCACSKGYNISQCYITNPFHGEGHCLREVHRSISWVLALKIVDIDANQYFYLNLKLNIQDILILFLILSGQQILSLLFIYFLFQLSVF